MVCQLDALQRCLTAASLKKSLRTLLKTLYDTYDRILLSIDAAYHQQARQVLQWLVVARRPLFIEEAAEVVTTLPITEDETPVFDVDNRLSDPNDIFQICLSLVTSTLTADSKIQNGQLVPAEHLRLAHYSVKEYLTSEAIKRGPCSEFFINEVEAHMSVSQACIVYLLSIDGPVSSSASTELPLAKYVANFWAVHAELGRQSKKILLLEDRVINLLQSVRTMSYIHVLCKPHYPPQSLIKKPALHWAVQYGLSNVVERILTSVENINTRDTFGRTALHVAIQFRRNNIACSLLRGGIDVDAQDLIGTALHYAVHTEDVSTVQILLDAKADPNLRTALRNTPLYSASERNNLKMVKLLLGHGADPNAPSKLNSAGRIMIEAHSQDVSSNSRPEPYHIGTPLQVAAWRGYSDTVAALLDAGAVIKNSELSLLAQGKVQEALQAMERTGDYPYHFQNQLPDYKEIVTILQNYTGKYKISE